MKQHKKVDVAAKIAARPLTYTLMVGYDPILETEIALALKNDGKKPSIIANTYFYFTSLRKEEAEHIAKLVKDVKFKFTKPGTSNQKEYKVRYIDIRLAPKMSVGKTVRVHKKRVSGTIHSSGSNTTNYDKKLSKRIKKATLAIIKAEAKKAVKTPKKGQNKADMKPVQQKLNFKAAA